MKIFHILILSLIVLSGCSESTNPNYDDSYDKLIKSNIYEAVNLVDGFKYSAPSIKSHITTGELIAEFPDGRIITKSIPDSLMYVAIAPYINTTHTCEIHYPSSCEGELALKEFKVTLRDSLGNFIQEIHQVSLKNGFFELWLPRNRYFKVHIDYNNLSADGILTSYFESKTCITTINLK